MSNWLHAVSSLGNFVVRNWSISRNTADPLEPSTIAYLLKMIVSGRYLDNTIKYNIINKYNIHNTQAA